MEVATILEDDPTSPLSRTPMHIAKTLTANNGLAGLASIIDTVGALGLCVDSIPSQKIHVLSPHKICHATHAEHKTEMKTQEGYCGNEAET